MSYRKYVEDGTERGGSFAVYHRGEPVVDLWGGYADPDSMRPWRGDTVTMLWSCTKGASALAVAKLVEKYVPCLLFFSSFFLPAFLHRRGSVCDRF